MGGERLKSPGGSVTSKQRMKRSMYGRSDEAGGKSRSDLTGLCSFYLED